MSQSSEPGQPGRREAETLEREVRLLWGAYAYLRNNDLCSASVTSRMLHECDLTYLRSRLVEELDELAGVLSGTHRHVGVAEDVVLEGSQVCYWVCLVSLCLGLRYHQLTPHHHLANRDRNKKSEIRSQNADELAEQLHRAARAALKVPREYLLLVLQNALQLVGMSSLACGIKVREIVRHDLNQMEKRAYMTPYFAKVSDLSGKG